MLWRRLREDSSPNPLIKNQKAAFIQQPEPRVVITIIICYCGYAITDDQTAIFIGYLLNYCLDKI
jgi:hypothetical protein